MSNTATRRLTRSATMPAAFRNSIAALIGTIGHWRAVGKASRQIARDTRALHEMDDRMLSDIGLHRSEIRSVVRFGRRPLI